MSHPTTLMGVFHMMFQKV
uniref:Uncharacterized protein n=1 Tax=Anguilla anguilla TaxID=7936 RepID=A0A0E9QUA1_ANGAN